MADKVDKTLPMREGEQALVDATNELIDEVAGQRTNNIAPFIADTASRSVAYSFAAGNAAACTVGNAVAIGNNAVASYAESAAIGSYAQTTRNNQVSVGRTDKLRTISFINTPIDDTDAATKQYVDTYQGTPADGSVTSAKLAAGAVTTDKVADKTVNEAKLTDALSIKLNQRKQIECFVVPSQTIAAGKYADYTYTYNYAYTKNPVILPIIYGSVMPTYISPQVTAVSTTSCTIRLTNNSSSSQTVTSCYVAVIDRG